MSNNTRSRESVPCFESVEALKLGLEAKACFEPVGLYPRDGSEILGEVEAKISNLNGVEPEQVLAYNSGMAAVTEAIDSSLFHAETDQPVLACSHESYTQTKRYIENFIRGKQAKVIYFDSGDPIEVARIINEKQPDVVVSETVSNYVNVPVLDTQFLLDNVRQQDKKISVVLDNTLPLSSALPAGELIEANDSVIVCESGTKSYSFNTELLGVSYTKNEDLRDHLRRQRRTRGTLPGPRSLEFVSRIIPEKTDFDERNFRIFKNTGKIAVQMSASIDKPEEFLISHPILPGHQNNEFYKSEYPRGGTPVFYIQSDFYDQYKVADALWQSDAVKDQAKLGQSFGFDHVRIVADESVGAVRIAGGAYTEGDSFGNSAAEALNRLSAEEED